MKKLVIYGTGLIAEVAEFYFRIDSTYEVAAFTNAEEFVKESIFLGKEVVNFENLTQSHPPSEYDLFIALGYAKTNKTRQFRFQEAKKMGYSCATYISSKAAYYSTVVGENCFILEHNVIQPYVVIGDNVTLWSGNHIGHHCRILNHCFVSSHVVISGGCEIGENCFLGVNSTLRDNIRLGAFSVIGSGAVVMKDCPERSLVTPASSDYRVVSRDLI